ncbi:Transcriptional regulator containing an amidase domain and an AraC-type DNA-binding HTH domain [Dokdonella koreensis DS-123]|uniref:Transcriptional regulator containing an amidase domain and an AraC-type DNA-binding HTH domain n=1 Tax=Dokdonella koreensis DS-123 TaxID=1300342 RepID=A0A167GC77_9GAMM|nr:Transcriptional regulator containing an amidase domain and an AraC-type DNA-binding HTH domain [Dokdonella koreensis DS-123]
MTKTGPQVTDHAPIEIAIVCYPGSQATCIHGVTDLFGYADYFARLHRPAAPAQVRVTHWRPPPDGGDLHCAYDSQPGPAGAPTLVVVPASQLAPMARGHAPDCSAWIARRHAEGAVVAAVCGGVFLLADSGLLTGRRATTHWMFAEELRRRFPDLAIDADRLVIDDGDIVTAGGVLAWADMGLSLVERLLGPAVMLATARFMLMDPPGREQRFYSDFTPRLQHGDKAILAAQHWLQAHAPAAFSIAALAGRAGLGTRTFLRRFIKATGMTPSEYHQQLRIARGRELLELTRDSIEQVAAATGYEDSGGFRRSFKRLVGLSPAEYRRRFQGARRAVAELR